MPNRDPTKRASGFYWSIRQRGTNQKQWSGDTGRFRRVPFSVSKIPYAPPARSFLRAREFILEGNLMMYISPDETQRVVKRWGLSK